MTLVVLGIVSSVAAPRFFNLSTFQQRAFFDDTLSALRYAQKLAVATGCNVQFGISGNQYELKRPAANDRSRCDSTTASDFTQSVPRPGGETRFVGSQSGVTLNDAAIYFSAKGTASANATILVGGRSVSVVQETGFVYDSTP